MLPAQRYMVFPSFLEVEGSSPMVDIGGFKEYVRFIFLKRKKIVDQRSRKFEASSPLQQRDQMSVEVICIDDSSDWASEVFILRHHHFGFLILFDDMGHVV